MTGAQLRMAREVLGLSQVQLAKQVGMHPVSISRFEHGHEAVPRVLEWAMKGLAAEGLKPQTDGAKKKLGRAKKKPKK